MLIKSVVSWSWTALIKSQWDPHSVGNIRKTHEALHVSKTAVAVFQGQQKPAGLWQRERKQTFKINFDMLIPDMNTKIPH
jgi:hypothetical protein